MMEITVTKENFQEILTSEKPVLIDFWATWCGPCRMIAPFVEEIASDYADRLTVGKVNVDEEPELAGEFGIESIPTLVILKGGKVEKVSIGYKMRDQLRAFVESAL